MRGYRVQECIGKGAFGTVYLAEIEGGRFRKKVAVKVLNPEMRSSKLLVRLKDEAHMLASLQYRSIVAVEDFVDLNGQPSIIMEYVEGVDLRAMIRSQPIPPRVALQIAEEVAQSLHIAWDALKLVHRDIKPDNVRITPRGEVKLLDFGVAKAELISREAHTTQTGFGTLAYMAVERLGGEDRHESDVYALGVMLFEMLTGHLPGKHSMDEDRVYPGKRNVEDWQRVKAMGLLPILSPMLAQSPEQRPRARECARQFRDLATQFPGENLGEWAERVVPLLPKAQSLADDRLGTLLLPRGGPQPRSGWLWGVLGVTGMSGMALLCAGGAGALAWWYWPVEKPVDPPAPLTVTPPGEPERVPDGTPAPSVAAPEPPRVTPTKKEAKVDTTVGRLTILGARGVLVDGAPVGKLAPGTYAVRVTFSDGTQIEHAGILVEGGKTTTVNCSADQLSCTTSVPW